MKWTSMSKKKQQALLIWGLAVTGGVALLIQFALIPALIVRRETLAKASSLRAEIRQTEADLKGETASRANHVESVSHLRQYLQTIPPRSNPFLWVTEQLYRMARSSEFSIDSLQEETVSTPSWIQIQKVKAAAAPQDSGMSEENVGEANSDSAVPDQVSNGQNRRFGPYRAQITGTADYEGLKRFLRTLEAEHPLAAIHSLDVTVGSNPDRQSICMTIEWPRYLGPDDAQPLGMGAPRKAKKP